MTFTSGIEFFLYNFFIVYPQKFRVPYDMLMKDNMKKI